MDQNRPKWTRRAFIESLPKLCLSCHYGNVLWTDRKTIRRNGGSCTEIKRMVAICMNFKCGAVYTQMDKEEEGKILSGFFCDRTEVIFVRTLPYHISLGGAVSMILDRDNFAKPGHTYPQGVVDVVSV